MNDKKHGHRPGHGHHRAHVTGRGSTEEPHEPGFLKEIRGLPEHEVPEWVERMDPPHPYPEFAAYLEPVFYNKPSDAFTESVAALDKLGPQKRAKLKETLGTYQRVLRDLDEREGPPGITGFPVQSGALPRIHPYIEEDKVRLRIFPATAHAATGTEGAGLINGMLVRASMECHAHMPDYIGNDGMAGLDFHTADDFAKMVKVMGQTLSHIRPR